MVEFGEVFRESIRRIMPRIWDETFRDMGDVLSEIYLRYLNSIFYFCSPPTFIKHLSSA